MMQASADPGGPAQSRHADRSTPLIRRCWYVAAGSGEVSPRAYQKTLGFGENEPIDRLMSFGFVSPGCSSGGSIIRRHNFWYTMRDFQVDSEPLTKLSQAASIKAFQEDKDALEWINDLVGQDPRREFPETSFRSDRGSVQMRRVLQELADAERE